MTHDADARFWQLAEAMPQIVWMTRPDGWHLHFNRQWMDYTGLTLEASLGFGWNAPFHPEDRPRAARLWHQATQDGQAYEIEYRLRRADGEYRWMLGRALPLRDDAGVITAWLGTCTDIHDLKSATERIARDRRLMQIAGKVARLGGWTIELPGRVLTWSDENCAIHDVPPGYTPTLEEGIGYFPPEYRDMVRGHVEACERDGTPYTFECPKVTAKGRRIWVRSIGEAVRDESGRIIGLQGAFQDITALKEAEDAIRESAERFRFLSRASGEAIYDRDLTNDAVWWSEAFEGLFGHAHGATARASWVARLHPADRDALLENVREAVEGDSANWSGSYRFQRRDGSYAWVQDRAHLIRDAQGKAIRMVGGIADVSDRLALEEQLRQSQRLEAVGQLTGGVAHDFNNLLTVILGNAEILKEALAADARLRPLSEMIVDASTRGADLVRSLLAYARKQPLRPMNVDTGELAAGIEPLLRRTIGEHIEIDLSREAGLWNTMVDPAQLESALLNLALNARDAMPGGGRLSISTSNLLVDRSRPERDPELAPGPYVMVTVSDTGCGIAPEHLPMLFVPFFTTKEMGKGTGLGLPMVYGFVKQSGGHIAVSSQPGRGTTIRLYFPRAEQQGPATDQPTRDTGAVGGSEVILMVEDDERVRTAVQGHLAALGYEVIPTGNGAEALDVIRSGRSIDLLFTDVVMPGMGGRELADQAALLRPGLKVLFTSGYTEGAFVQRGLDPGTRLLGKPYRPAELARHIRTSLGSP